MLFKTFQITKRFLRIFAGFALLVAGVVLLVSPGPGWLLIALGLGLLSVDFIWARHLLDRLRVQGVRLRDAIVARKLPRRA